MLKLKGANDDGDTFSQMARRIVVLVKQHPQLKSSKKTEMERLLFNIAYQHVSTIGLNAFSEEAKCSDGGICTRYTIFDV